DGEVVSVNTPIAIIEMEEAVNGSPVAPTAPPKAEKPEKEIREAVKNIEATVSAAKAVAGNGGGNRFYSPLVLNIARQEKLGMSELENIAGTGAEGRVTKRDILAYIQNRSKTVATPPKESRPQPPHQVPQPAVSIGGGDEIIEMDRMRKLIADHMVMSKHT